METSTIPQTIVIPRVISPQGWIASAKTYRLTFNEDGLYLIHLGRAMGNRVKSGDRIADALANKIVNHMEAKMEAALATAEKEIEGVPLSDLLKRKKSYFIPTYENGAVTCKIRANLPAKLIIRATGLKLTIIGPPDAGPGFEKIAHAFA